MDFETRTEQLSNEHDAISPAGASRDGAAALGLVGSEPASS